MKLIPDPHRRCSGLVPPRLHLHQVAGAIGGLDDSANFLALSNANVNGGAIYSDAEDYPGFAARPDNSVPLIVTVGNWVAAGPSNNNNGGGDATLTLPTRHHLRQLPVGLARQLQHADRQYRCGSMAFTAGGLGILPVGGSQVQANYVNFTPTGGGYGHHLAGVQQPEQPTPSRSPTSPPCPNPAPTR